MADSTDRRKRKIRREADRARRRAERGTRWTYGPDPTGTPDGEGGAGVREPRRPTPTTPAAGLALDEPVPVSLDLTADR